MAAYELIDFGEGRKLEALGRYWIDRPAPAAVHAPKQQPALWSRASARYDGRVGLGGGSWTFRKPWPAGLTIEGLGFQLPAQPSPMGHIGIFPEQRPHWQWLQAAVRKHGGRCRGLNLFAYTGGATLAMAAAGAAVAHVDAARPNVAQAFQAATESGLQNQPIRFLVDDAVKFVRRELRRGNRYEIICLDPPAYGHGPQGHAWRLMRDLWPLLDNTLQLLLPSGHLLLTGHSRQPSIDDIRSWLLRHRGWEHLQAGRSQLQDRAGRILNAGHFLCGRTGPESPGDAAANSSINGSEG
jgi:23S rRNA (cytosine1962-C5)-methyltransferase